MDPPPLVSKESLPDLWAMPQASSDDAGILWPRPESAAGVRIGFNSLFADGSSLTEQSIQIRAARKHRVAISDDDSSKIISTCSGDDLAESDSKRQKVNDQRDQEEAKMEAEVNSGGDSKKGNPSVGPKQDYIHVRARRGQATDSHSLAERARREKISERMKILQDLVPGCNKVIGKALVLDEIINYIQSLQHQVEFLSMKLEALSAPVNHCMEGFPEEPFETTSRFSFHPSPPPPMALPPPPPPSREYVQVPAEWLDMQVGGGFKRASGS